MGRGKFFSLDGLDGTGKTTQCRLLAEWLRGQSYDVVACADPGATPVGDVIRALLLQHQGEFTLACEALLFMASRAQLADEVIGPALAKGQLVVCDRFSLANVVYQGHAGGLDSELLWRIAELATGGLEPDLTVVLDLPVEIARGRKGKPTDRLERRGEGFQDRVRAGFLKEARRRPDRFRVLDASSAVDIVQEQIRQEVARVLATHPGT